MNKKRNIIIGIVLFTLILLLDLVFIKLNGGLVGFFHLKNEDEMIDQGAKTIVSTIAINQKETTKTIYVNQTIQLTLSDDLGNNKLNGWNYTWLTSNSNIATVSSSGLLIGKNPGQVTIRVTNKNNVNLYDIMHIQVIQKENKLRFSTTENNMDNLLLGEVRKLSVVTGGEVSLHELQWTSSNEDILTVENGYITAHALGVATIQVQSTFDSSFVDTMTIEVKDHTSKLESPTEILINHIYINNKEITLDALQNTTFQLGDKLIINANANLKNNYQVIFTSLSSSIHLVSSEQQVGSFVFEEVGIGKIQICSKYDASVLKEIDIVIGDETKQIEAFTMANETEVSINNYLTLDMQNKNQTIDFSDYSVKVENPDILSYESGCLCPIQLGTTAIRITYLYDKQKTIETTITVTEAKKVTSTKHIELKNSSKNNSSYTLHSLDVHQVEVGDVIRFQLELVPLNTSYFDKIKIFSSDSNGCVVTSTIDNYTYDVNLKFLKKGHFDIYIKSFNDEIETETLKFQVGENDGDFDFSIIRMTSVTMGKAYTLKLEKKGTEPADISYQFHSSNPHILSIGNTGEMFALDEGKVTITVSATFGRTTIEKSMEIMVVKEYKTYDKATSMTCNTYIKQMDTFVPIDFKESFLNVHQKAYMSVNVSPNHGTTRNYEVYSSDESIITISYVDYQYQLYALKPGVATISIINYENESLNQEMTIHVYDVLPKYYVPLLESNVLTMGEVSPIDFLSDEQATYTKAVISFQNEDVVKLVDNKIIPLHVGSTIMKIQIQNDIEEYILSIPLQVVQAKEKGLFDYSISELIVYFLIHTVLYFALGMLLCNLLPKGIVKIIVLSILPLLIVGMECIKGSSIFLTLLTIGMDCIFYGIGILVNYFQKKKVKQNEK